MSNPKPLLGLCDSYQLEPFAYEWAWKMARAERDFGLEVIGSVHDELICLAREEDDMALKRLISYMTTPPAWGKDIPLNAAGWTGSESEAGREDRTPDTQNV